ncbi:hypothetical protein BDV38DRAFT_290661 [Aspergillus pseudotamarii]|uniref:Uncharacterized protein n=1 Tax=Aspergillus pseudotamarii TaxID=132259 RepID=A0A5N6SB88_ASPPS|nr:uncharacterized protein BDV38DRAFT_290661 [Aspergillus pseudotamarii]KAE8131109.1 hypothetical protein BDV38DRAFT_290661 [Aspergillus pseudotamarii]
MAPRTIYLISIRFSKSQPQQSTSGSLINVIGAPMVGFADEYKRGCEPTKSIEPYEMWSIGGVDSVHIVDWPVGVGGVDTDPMGDLEIAASQVPAPGISQDFIAPVNDITNRRCQEWTMEYVRHLVEKEYVGAEAIQIVQPKRDPPTHGIGLRRVVPQCGN